MPSEVEFSVRRRRASAGRIGRVGLRTVMGSAPAAAAARGGVATTCLVHLDVAAELCGLRASTPAAQRERSRMRVPPQSAITGAGAGGSRPLWRTTTDVAVCDERRARRRSNGE